MPSIPGQRKAGKRNNAPAPAGDNKLVPATIADNPEKFALWNFLVADLELRGIWSSTYSLALAEFINCVFRLQEITAILDEEGLQVEKYSAKGDMIGWQKHPLLSEENSIRATFGVFLKKFGMTPADIAFLIQGELNPDNVIDAEAEESAKKGIVYFR